MSEWVYEKAEAKIGQTTLTVERSDDRWEWHAQHNYAAASGICQSFELAQERAIKCATFFNKEM